MTVSAEELMRGVGGVFSTLFPSEFFLDFKIMY